MNKTTSNKFAKYFETLLKKSSISKADLSREMKLKRQNYINNIISGIHTPTLARVREIAKALKCTKQEENELIQLAVKERSSKDSKEFLNNIEIINSANFPSDLLNFPSIEINGLRTDKNILASFSFEIKSELSKDLEPLIHNVPAHLPARVIVNYSAPFKIGDIVVLEINNSLLNKKDSTGKYSTSLSAYKKNPQKVGLIVINSGSDCVLGIITKIDSHSYELRNLKYQDQTISIQKVDVGLKGRIMGILF